MSTIAAPSLAKAIGTTFGTYCIADFLSNFIQHPTQKMDYGVFNKMIGREVQSDFWGTRTEHIVGVAGCLAITDHASQALFAKYLKKPLCFAKSPAAFVAHTFFFIFSGVTLYCGADAAMNPEHEGKRMDVFKEETYNSYVGSNTAWFEPFVPGAFAMVAGPAVAGTWFGSSLLPATLAYTTVKGVGWNDWGNSGLNDLELKLNGVQKSLKEINLPQNLTEISKYAFRNCYSLKQIALPHSITRIDHDAFANCSSLVYAYLPTSIQYIGGVRNCYSLKQIALPHSITRIDHDTFANCSSLVYAYLPTTIQYIDGDTFSNFSRLSVIAATQQTNIEPNAFAVYVIINQVCEEEEMELNAILQQRFNNHPFYQVCYDPSIISDSLAACINRIRNETNDYEHIDAFPMEALHILCYDPSDTDDMINALIHAFPSLRSMQSVKRLTLLIMYIKNKHGSAARNIIESKSRLGLDDFLRHRILREDETIFMLAMWMRKCKMS